MEVYYSIIIIGIGFFILLGKVIEELYMWEPVYLIPKVELSEEYIKQNETTEQLYNMGVPYQFKDNI